MGMLMLTIEEMRREIQDVKVMIDRVFHRCPDDIVIGGGFARRLYMLENGIPIKPEDNVRCDIDIFVGERNLSPLMKSGSTRLYDMGDDPTRRDEDMNQVNTLWSDLVDMVVDAIKFPKVLIEPFPLTSVYHRSHLFSKMQFDIRAVSNDHIVKNLFNKHHQGTVNASPFMMTVPVFDHLQIVGAIDVYSKISSFDIEQCKFISRYPFDTVEYVGREFDDIYHIQHMEGANHSFIKTIKRMEKYSNYGFTFSPECIKNIIDIDYNDINISDMVCYVKGLYA